MPDPFLFCADDDCAANLGFKSGIRRACRDKRQFYGPTRHTCRATRHGFVTDIQATQHNLRLVKRTSPEGRQLQQQTKWQDTDFLIVPEDCGIRPTSVVKRKAEGLTLADLDEDTRQRLKTEVMLSTCNALHHRSLHETSHTVCRKIMTNGSVSSGLLLAACLQQMMQSRQLQHLRGFYLKQSQCSQTNS